MTDDKKHANIKLELKTLTPTALALLMGYVAGKMEGNVAFPNPPIPPAELQAARAQLTMAINAAYRGSQLNKLIRDELVVAGKQMLRKQADYVRMVAQGDAVIFAKSGFTLTHPSTGKAKKIGTPALKAAIMTGYNGQVELRWTGVANRRSYLVYISETNPIEPGHTWSLQGVTSKVKHAVEGLVPYKAYWFCVSAVGSLGESAKSNPIVGRAAM